MANILLPQRDVTPKYIKEVKEKYNLSWNDMDGLMRYAQRSRNSYHAYTYPDKYLTDGFKRRFIGMVSKLEKDRGHTFEIVNLIKKVLPKSFRIAVAPRRCAGHGEWTFFEKPTDKYCSDECRELAKQKEKRR